MPESRTIGTLANEVRSKNAGPFWMTLEVFVDDKASYDAVAGRITPEIISQLYAVAPDCVLIFPLPDIRVIKVSFPRSISQGGLHDRDMHAGQHHVPLSELEIIERDPRST
jgi:hypothetical protein